MYKTFTLSIFTALISGLFLITGCSSSDDGGGGATVPADAILIDNSLTAETTTSDAISKGELVVSVFTGVEASTTLTGKDILNIAIDQVRNDSRDSTSFVTGVTIDEDCPGGGTISGDETMTATTYDATATFTDCVVDSVTLTGTISISRTFSVSPGPYTDNFSGDLTVTVYSDTIGFNRFSFAENGDTSTGNYTVTTFTYTIDPSTGDGYLVQLTQSLVGNEWVSCELESGQILITGAAGSQARGTINPDRTLKVEYHSGDGNFVETDNSPLQCPM